MHLKVILHYRGTWISRSTVCMTLETFREIMPGFIIGISNNFLQGAELDFLVWRLRQAHYLTTYYAEPYLANIVLIPWHTTN